MLPNVLLFVRSSQNKIFLIQLQRARKEVPVILSKFFIDISDLSFGNSYIPGLFTNPVTAIVGPLNGTNMRAPFFISGSKFW